MMTIDLYCGDPEAPLNAAEQRVLARIIGILHERDESAIVLTNVPCEKRECDILVSTPTTTLVIEVKGYHHPVAGGLDDASWVNLYTGERRNNPCLQVRHTMLALKDALRRFAGQDPGYPRCVVVFDGGAPAGSEVPEGTDRIVVASDSDLEKLLAWPLIERNQTRRWPVELLRAWAFERGMVRDNALEAESLDSYARPPVTIEVLPPIERAPTPVFVEARPERRPPLRRRLWPIAAALLVPVAVGQWWLSHARVASTALVALGTAKKGTPQRHHKRRLVSTVDAAVAPVPSTPAPVPRNVTTIETPPVNGGPLPPCPAGIDRLGCVPDSATLRQLRGG